MGAADVAKWVDSTVTRRSTARDEHRRPQRDRIVAAACQAIEEHGVDVGTAEIAALAGVARPHVYRYFDSKDDLADEVARTAATALVETVRPTLSVVGTAPEILHGVLGAAVGWAAEHPQLYRFTAARQQTKATHRARLGRTRFLAEVVAATAAYLRASEVDPDRWEAADGQMAGLMGMVDASIIWWLDHRDETQDAVVARISRQVWLVMADVARGHGLELDETTVLGAPLG